MGANQTCCSTRIRQSTSNLAQKDVFVLMDAIKHSQDNSDSNMIDQGCFERLFQDTPALGLQIYSFCTYQLKCDPIPLEGCVNTLQAMLSGQDYTQILLMIVLGTYDKTPPTITAQSGYQFLGLIVQLYIQFTIRKQQLDATVLEIVINSLFKEPTMKTTDFLTIIEVTFPHINKLIKSYLHNRLLQKQFNQMRIPKIEKDSFILKYEWLALLGLASSDIHTHGQLTLLYQSALQAISFTDMAGLLYQPQTFIVCTFADDSHRKHVCALYSKSGFKPEGLDVPMRDGQICFQLQPVFQIFRYKTAWINNFSLNNFGFGKDPKSDRFLVQLSPYQSYFGSCMKFLTVEIWRLEELQSKLRKSVMVDDDRVSQTSPREQKKRVSFRIGENNNQRKSVSANSQIFDTAFDQIPSNEPSSPMSPHFTQHGAVFKNPSPQVVTKHQNGGQHQIGGHMNGTQLQSNRPSQNVIDKYQAKHRSTSNNQDLRKSVDEILKRYEKKQL